MLLLLLLRLQLLRLRHHMVRVRVRVRVKARVRGEDCGAIGTGLTFRASSGSLTKVVRWFHVAGNSTLSQATVFKSEGEVNS